MPSESLPGHQGVAEGEAAVGVEGAAAVAAAAAEAAALRKQGWGQPRGRRRQQRV